MKKRFRSTTDSRYGFVVAENLVNREFDAVKPNQVWLRTSVTWRRPKVVSVCSHRLVLTESHWMGDGHVQEGSIDGRANAC